MRAPTYLSRAEFLQSVARRLRTTPERIPAIRATEELLSWIEAVWERVSSRNQCSSTPLSTGL